jgi:ElaB/YqjD/DUF883 family membrane-anchored ribosome-binding protein
VNVLEDPNGLAELQKLGVRSVPVLSRGDKYTFGQSTKQIIDFLGLAENGGPQLSTEELAARVDKFMGAALELIPLMPHDRLDRHVPGRPRSYRTLAFHLFRVVDAFIGANEGTTLVQEMFREEPAPDADSAALVSYGEQVRRRFNQWFAERRYRAVQDAGHLLRPAEPARAVGAHDLALRPACAAIHDVVGARGRWPPQPIGAGGFRQATDAPERVGRLGTRDGLARSPEAINSPGSNLMRNSAAQYDGKELSQQIALMRTQLEELAHTVNGTKNTLVGRGGEVLDDALHSARDLIAKYGDNAKTMAKDAKDKAGETLIQQTEAHPFSTLAAIVGIGFLAGWLCRRR